MGQGKVKLGFTGTRIGMSEFQNEAFTDLIKQVHKSHLIEFHHGDCIGADADADAIARLYNAKVIIHPPSNNTLRAHCTSPHILSPKPYLIRNQNIVDACEILIAAPRTVHEILRSGTWATIRYARHQGVKVKILPRSRI